MKKFAKLLSALIAWGYVLSGQAYAAVDIGLDALGGKTGLPTKTVPQVISDVLRFITGVIAVLCVFVIVVAGIMYITAAGDTKKAETAKDWIIHAITGLVIAILAYTIVIITGKMVGAAW